MEQLMEKKQLISALERLANDGDNIVESAVSRPISSFKSAMFCSFSSFMEWRSAVLTILKQNGLHKNEFANQIEKVSENTAARKVYVEAAVQQLKGLIKAYEQDYIEIENNNKAKGGVSDLENIFNKFTRIVRQLRSRHDNRETLTIKDEYDVQDLLHALLVLHFDDVRAEEWTPSYAGGCERMDFLLKDLQTVIEVKKTRSSMSKKELGEELIIDIEKYKTHQDCKQLYCFIYDPDGYLGNSSAIKNDLEKTHQGFVKIFIRPEV